MAKAGDAKQIGDTTRRIDGHRKVTGEARYPSDMPVANPAYAWLVTSAIAKGRITRIDDTDSRQVEGLLDVLTHQNMAGKVHMPKDAKAGKDTSTTVVPLDSAKVWNDGQIVAMVLAETLESARDAAQRLVVEYAPDSPSASFDDQGVSLQPASEASKEHADPGVGDAQAAFAQAPITVEATYFTPTQHHNPIELFTTTCFWEDDQLTVYEPSQFVYGLKSHLAGQLGIDPEQVHVVSRFIGGAFGSKGTITPRTALVALAAQRLKRPVKLVVTRDQGFTVATYRAETRQTVKLGADKDGKLQALIHEGWEVTSRPDNYMVSGTATTSRMYACPNVATKVGLVHADRNTPGFMRSPPELPYMFGLESAMDELAVKLGMDPVELRLVNDTKAEPIKGLPYSSRSLRECYQQAAASFGWSKRTAKPGSMRDGDWLIGWGCASSCYPSHIAPAVARVTLYADGKARVQTATHEIGTGVYTVVAITAADRLGLAVEDIKVEIGDSSLPPAPVAGGSNSTASVCNAVAKACEEIARRLAAAAVGASDSPFHGHDPNGIALVPGGLRSADGAQEDLQKVLARINGAIEVVGENVPDGLQAEALAGLYQGKNAMTGGTSSKDSVRYAFGAVFVETRVHQLTREVRCSRAVGAFAAGTIVNPLTARSQLMGGMIWGVSAALHEATEIDRRAARYVNDNLADYLIPVNADIGTVEVILVPEKDDKVNPLSIKGIGELGDVGTNAAIANAVYHATGIRIRDLPVRIEKLL